MNLNIILLGTNPLPCYVQAAFVLQSNRTMEVREEEFLPKPNKILFVVTEETEKYITYMKALLDQPNSLYEEPEKLKSGRDAKEIEEAIKNRIDKILNLCPESRHHILLNDTGGTKMMTTHAALACKKYANEKKNRVTVVECYVDPESNRLRCIDLNSNEEEEYPSKIGGKSLKDRINMNVDQLVRLHYGNEDITLGSKKDLDVESFLGITSEEFLEIAKRAINKFDIYKEFFRLCKANVKEKTKSGRKEIDIRKELILDNPQVTQLFRYGEQPGEILINKFTKKRIDFWGSGKWLELYFYLAVIDAKKRLEEKKKHLEVVWSYTVKRPGCAAKEFEVDIVAVRGFVLTLFSITMVESLGEAKEGKGEEALAKTKWFEAVYRTEQIGGGHGQTQLVCLVPNGEDGSETRDKLESFKKDLEKGNADMSVRIKTIDDIKDYEELVEELVRELE